MIRSNWPPSSVRSMMDPSRATATSRTGPVPSRYRASPLARPASSVRRTSDRLDRPPIRALPRGGEQSPVVEGQAARSDDRVPIVDGLFHAVERRDAVADGSATVVLTIGYDRPAIVLACFRSVEFVAAAGTMLDRP